MFKYILAFIFLFSAFSDNPALSQNQPEAPSAAENPQQEEPCPTPVIKELIPRATGLRVISVDYTTAPFAKWQQIQEQVISVFKALLAEGYTMKDIALYGDSAGGGLATSTVLNLRDRGMGMPAAVVLWSPWVDLTNAGDSPHTLANTDPKLHYDPVLKNSAIAFADGLDLTDPRVSPLYADLSKGFSPVLITDGTKCIFLSTSVRLYQALETAGQQVKLDIYEGMWHVFQQNPMPESEVAIKKSAGFIHQHLGLVK
jgi:acetyl esterase/lipase